MSLWIMLLTAFPPAPPTPTTVMRGWSGASIVVFGTLILIVILSLRILLSLQRLVSRVLLSDRSCCFCRQRPEDRFFLPRAHALGPSSLEVLPQPLADPAEVPLLVGGFH